MLILNIGRAFLLAVLTLSNCDGDRMAMINYHLHLHHVRRANHEIIKDEYIEKDEGNEKNLGPFIDCNLVALCYFLIIISSNEQ